MFTGGQHGRSDENVLGVVRGNNNVGDSRLSQVQAEHDILSHLGFCQLFDVDWLTRCHAG